MGVSNVMRTPLYAILTLAVCLAGPALAEDKPQPKAVLPEPIHDFGDVDKSAKLEHDFEVRNAGAAPLLISEVRPECACTVANFDESIAPGKSGKIHINFDTIDLEGPVQKTIMVFTNDPASPELQLTVTAKVKPGLTIKPGYARYNYVQQEAPGVVTQTVWAADGAAFKILEVKSPYPYLKTTFWEAKPEERLPDHPGKQWRISSTLEPDAPVGPLEKHIEITTDHPKQRLLRVPVSGFVRPIIAVTPPTADIGNHKRGDGYHGSLVVKSYSTEPIAVTDVTSDVRGLMLKLETVTEGRFYRIGVSFADDVPVGPFSGKIKIKTGSAKTPVVEVPLSGAIEK